MRHFDRDGSPLVKRASFFIYHAEVDTIDVEIGLVLKGIDLVLEENDLVSEELEKLATPHFCLNKFIYSHLRWQLASYELFLFITEKPTQLLLKAV